MPYNRFITLFHRPPQAFYFSFSHFLCNYRVKCEIYGSVVSYPKNDIVRVEKRGIKSVDEKPITSDKEKAKTSTFKDKFLYPLKWGMSVELFKSSYPRTNELIQYQGYYQDISLPFYGHTSTAGFRFGEKGLDHIVISFLFRDKDRRLNQSDVLGISNDIYKQLEQSYGKPKVRFPWDGRMFNNIWVVNETLIMFAWDGGDGWGVQFRSVEIDPMARNMVNQMKGN